MEQVKLNDLIQVWINDGLSLNLFEVYDIFKSEQGGYIFECFEVAIKDKSKIVRSTFTEYIHDSDVVGVIKPLRKLKDDNKIGTLDKES